MQKCSNQLIAEKVNKILETVQLRAIQSEHECPVNYPEGQQQRAALARALVIEPEVLLLLNLFAFLGI